MKVDKDYGARNVDVFIQRFTKDLFHFGLKN